jgi:RHS repeat-associated protein
VDETPVAGQQFDYVFDTIGNRTQTEAGGDQNGANLRVAGYTNNTLNQITSRGVPAAVDVMGDGLATNGVTVNGLTAYRKNEYFRQQLSVTNTSPVWDGVTVIGSGQTNTGHLYVPQAPETNTYDADGNLLTDGRWTNSWDAENRLLSMTSLSTAPSGSQLQLAFTYDYMGRRIQKLVSTNNGSYIGEYTNKYAYDAWNCLAILNPSLVLSNSFLWGSDLSGSPQGAGGVGGLIKVAYYGAATTNCFVAYDGNGNVSALVNAANGVTVANYDYGPFGELIRCSGPIAKLNPAREGSKMYEDETGFLYYGYRYYNPSTGRWLSRDPMVESGGMNLYDFVGNEPLQGFDFLGLFCSCCCCVDSLQIGEITAFIEPKMGNSFTVNAGLSYVPSPKTASCSLEWKEKSNLPFYPGVPVNTWANANQIWPNNDVFFPWNNRKQPCPGSENISLTDTPSFANFPAGRSATRILEFEITVKSSPGCHCASASKTVRAKQVLVMLNGQPQWNQSSFEVLP